MKNIAIIQARMGSSRLPGKVLMNINGGLVIDRVVTVAKNIPHIDKVIVATSTLANDDEIEKWCEDNNTHCFRGSEINVLERYYMAAKEAECEANDIIMRLTADCPLLDPLLCGQVMDLRKRTGKDYANNIGVQRLWPDGTDCEVFTFDALEKSYQNAKTDRHKEHVTLYIRENADDFDVAYLACPISGLGMRRWTLDTKDDFNHISGLLSALETDYGARKYYSYYDVLSVENNTFSQSLGNKNGLDNSHAHLDTALGIIPDASQTFSKSHRQLIKGISPYFLDHGQGAYVWDIDGNCYLDYMCALLPVLLAYNDQDVDEAIKIQLGKGISFTLPTLLEEELAERLVKLIPSAEMVRFAKNGSDVTSASIRLARAYTGRTQIAICGYHGWHDWYIGSTDKRLGVPQETVNLSDAFSFNDINSLKALLEKKKYAAIILEAEGFEKSKDGFLENVRKCADEHGAVLIFDEIVSGFRSAIGGIQELRGVVPDLSCFGKAMGNGMPLSAIVGKKDIMEMISDVFFSSTFGGETLSLAAGIACLDKYQRCNGVDTINKTGKKLQNSINDILKEHGINEHIFIGGESWWPGIMVKYDDPALCKKLIRQELFKNGIIQGSGFNLSVAHADPIVQEQTLEAWNNVASTMQNYLSATDMKSFLHEGHSLENFQVRKQ